MSYPRITNAHSTGILCLLSKLIVQLPGKWRAKFDLLYLMVFKKTKIHDPKH